MQVKQRIKKIEEKMSLANPVSIYCDCWKKHWHSEAESAYNENPEIKIEIYPAPDFEKGFCARCQKPIPNDDTEMHQNFVEIWCDKPPRKSL